MPLNHLKISKFIKSTVSGQRKNLEMFSFLVVANVLTAAAGWLTQVKIANTLGKVLFGEVAFAIVLGTFGQVFIRLGLDRTLVRDLIHYPDRFADLVKASLALRYVLAFITLVGLLMWKLLNVYSSLSWGVLLIAMATAILSLDLQPVYDAAKKIKHHTLFFLLQKILYLLLIWIVILICSKYLSVFLIGVFLLTSVTLYLYLQHRWIMARLCIKMTDAQEYYDSMLWLIRHNWLVWVTALAGLAIVMLNQLILKYYSGFSVLGGYAAAWQLVMIGTLLLEQVSRIGRPAMARITRPEVSKNARIQFIIKYLSIMIVVVAPLVFIMFFFSDLFFRIVFKPEYATSSIILPIMGAYMLFFSIGMVSSQYLLSARLEKIYFYSVITGGIMSIILCFTLIPLYGGIGAAWALLLSHGTTILIYSLGMVMHVREQN